MPVLRMLDGELELFEQSLIQPDAVRYLWKNAGSQFGVIFTVHELETLLGRIGSNPRWDWIWLRKEFDEDRWTQACGRAVDGLVVEVNGPSLVTRVGSAVHPRINVGTTSWNYLAARAEVHPISEAARLQLGWLENGAVGELYELRDAPDGPSRQ